MNRNPWTYADEHTCKTLLNCYLRECEGTFIYKEEDHSYEIPFPSSRATITGKLTYYSAMGEHEYQSYFIRQQRIDYMDIASLIVKELESSHSTLSQSEKMVFLKKVSNSFHKLNIFLSQMNDQPVHDYISSEQSLIHGHPFHPFPKNREGFYAEEIDRYSPECHTAFQLGYVAVKEDTYVEKWVHEKVQFPDPLMEEVKRRLGDQYDDYRVLPMHPWQYEHVQRVPEIKVAIREGTLQFLGKFGPMAYPTSSVRTVYVPEMTCNLKLPLDVQITNLKRNNTVEQMRRTLQATHYLMDNKCFSDEPYTQISYETATASCHFDDEKLKSMFTYAYRPVNFDTSRTMIASSLVEWNLSTDCYQLEQVVGRIDIEDWFERYLEISLVPIVRLIEDKGVHFEAHLQNCLVTLDEGMPVQFIIRDLEGVSVEREKATNVDANDKHSYLFYSTQAARERTIYYFFVNHLGSLIHVIAQLCNVSEQKIWQRVDEVLDREYKQTNNQFVKQVRESESFIAKTNMVSCLLSKGETPSFVRVNNVMHTTRRDLDVRKQPVEIQ
ncbi:hypothetical protein DH09_11860 [Bacillaceae bacterium JMAK1]|nr:hypothetical protein DH09_11860 [Bacillaceae bacterium JMAK1]